MIATESRTAIAQRLRGNTALGIFVRGSAWTISGSGFSQVLMLAGTVLVCRYLGTIGFGEFGMIRSTASLFDSVASAGLGLTASKHVAEFRYSNPAKAGRLLALIWILTGGCGLVISAIVFFSARDLATQTLNNARLIVPLRFASALILTQAIDSVQTGTLAGLHAFRRIAVTNVVSAVVGVPLMVIGARYGGLEGAILGLVLIYLCRLLMNCVAWHSEVGRSQISLKQRNIWQEHSLLWSFSLPVFLSGLLSAPSNWVANTILARTAAGYAELGVYTGAVQWLTMACAIPNMLLTVATPVLCQLPAASGARRRFALRLLAAVSLVSISAALAVGTTAPYLMRLLGKGFADRYDVLWLILAAAVVSNVAGVIRVMVLTARDQWGLTASYAIYAVTAIAVTYAARNHGAIGRASAHMAADILLCVALGTVAFHMSRKLAMPPVRYSQDSSCRTSRT